MYIQNNQNPYQNSLQSISSQSFPNPNQTHCFPSQETKGYPKPAADQNTSNGNIMAIVTQMSAVIQNALSILGDTINKLTGLLTGKTPQSSIAQMPGVIKYGPASTTGNKESSSNTSDIFGKIISGISDIFGSTGSSEKTQKAEAEKESKSSSSWLSSLADIGSSIYKYFF